MKNKISHAFTIVELLIVIFIFSSVLVIASSSFVTSYITGRTHASGSMEANRSLSNILDIIGQKMANASGTDGDRYGFRESAGRLTIVLKDNATCVYFQRDGDDVKMLQDRCVPDPTSLYPLSDSHWEKISSPEIKITDFSFPHVSQCDSRPCTTAPYITVNIAGEDAKTGGKATLETAYSIPAYTYNKW